MRNTSKMTTLENKFPLLAVEHGCIISKDADITVAFEVELPELYTVTGAEYEAIHGCWCKAIKVLPDFCVVHKQDWFIKEKYTPELQKEDMSFLSRSNERHFNERPYLKHTCYLYLTKTTKERNRMQSNFSTLCRGHIIPKVLDKETAAKFMEAAEQFERIINDSGFVRLRRLSTDEIVGTDGKAGLIERYFSLMPEGDATLQDIDLSAREMRIGDNRLCLHTLSDAEDLPGTVATDTRYEKLSTDRSDCRLSFASPVGLLLSCNHIYNQYVIIDNSEENLQKFEKSARNMQSLSRYSRSNSINREWIDRYLNEAHSYGLTSVRAHFNVMAWSDDAEGLKHIKNDVGSQLAFIDVSQLPQIRELVSLFISEGADVNHQNAAGETPLMACCRGMLLGDDSLDRLKLGIARLLLDHRADPSLRDKYGRTALQRIGNRSNEHLQMVLKYLPELSAPPLPKKENR